MESYKHKFAKDVLAGWLPGLFDDPEMVDAYSAVKEFPIALDASGKMHGLDGWRARPPTYEELLARELLPIAIFDVMVLFHFSINPAHCFPRYALEVVHKHDISPQKEQYLNRIAHTLWDVWHSDFAVDVIDADWILSRCAAPRKLTVQRRMSWLRGVRV